LSVVATPEPIPAVPRSFVQRPSVALGDVDPSANGITALRLFLAAWVLVFHVFPLGGFGTDPTQIITGGQLRGGATIAVLGFFGLSGYLLVHSRRRTSPVAFAWRRALRILPGYWGAIAVTAAIVGPWYLLAAALPLPGVADLTFGNPPETINYSLWTLFPEILCYVALAVMPVRFMAIAIPTLLASLTLIGASLLPTGTAGEVYGFLLAFWTGATMAIANIKPSGRVALALLVVLALATVLGRFNLAMGFVFAYVALWAGFAIPLRWERDVSYGTYIYAFPITRGLAALGASSLGFVPFTALALAATLSIAAVSWVLIERPALSLKRLIPTAGLSLARR
jgi:peptidoglycan/LPS O-acetylase OafA/YrhL